MLEVNANSFLGAATQFARLHQIVAGLNDRAEAVEEKTASIAINHLDQFAKEADIVGARLAVLAAQRLAALLRKWPITMNIGALAQALGEIESRFGDHLLSIQMFALSEVESLAFQPGHQLLSESVAIRYPSIIFEIEESAKCLALGRATASAFHSMRAVEVMIAGFRKYLGVEDSEKPAERNWSFALRAIKNAMDVKYPSASRKSGSDGARAESIYLTLDAIKNPWRNATMHVEQTYQPFEAGHILQCVNVLAKGMAEICNEDGETVPTLAELFGDEGEPANSVRIPATLDSEAG
jgi:hypothetical protein